MADARKTFSQKTLSQKTLAIFDLDYTLTKRGTWGRFVWANVARRPHLWLPLIGSTAAEQWRYKSGKIPRGAVKKQMMRWSLTGRPRDVLCAKAERFAGNEISQGLRPGAVKALGRHKEAGDHILIASAAVDLIVAPIARRLAVDGFVSTEMDWTNDGRLAPEFASANCYGPEKLTRVKAYIAQHGLEAYRTVFYTDSYADIEVMRFCDVAIAVNPDTKLQARAAAEGYAVEDWMQA